MTPKDRPCVPRLVSILAIPERRLLCVRRPGCRRRRRACRGQRLATSALPHAPAPARRARDGVDPAGARVPRAPRSCSPARRRVVAATAGRMRTASSGSTRSPPGRYELRVGGGRLPRPSRSRSSLAAGEETRVAFGLHVSAVTESVVVSAAQVELPLARAADSVTVISSRDLQARAGRRRSPTRCGLVPGLTVSRNGGRGARDVAVPARRRVGLHARAGRRHQGERLRRRLRLLDAVREPRSSESRSCAARRARCSAPTRSAPSCRSSRGAAAARASKALVEGGSFGTSRAGAGTWGSRGALELGRVGRTHGERRLHRDRARHGRGGVERRLRWRPTRAFSARLARGQRRRRPRVACATCRATAATRARTARTRSAPTRRSTGSRAAHDVRFRPAARWTQPFSAGGRTLRQTVSASYFDLTSDFTQRATACRRPRRTDAATSARRPTSI